MNLSSIPRERLLEAAERRENRHARETLLRAAGVPQGHLPTSVAGNVSQGATQAAGKGKKRGEMNRTERAFADVVLGALVAAGEIDRWEYEALTLRIPNVGAVTPDFVGYRDNQIRVLFEVKGAVVHEASVLRIKAHAAARPWWRWMIYRRPQGGWAVYWDSAQVGD